MTRPAGFRGSCRSFDKSATIRHQLLSGDIMPRYAVSFCLVCAFLFGACEGIIDPSENKLEMFTGTVVEDGTNRHDFTVSKNGEFEVKITQMSPNQDAFMGLQYGPLLNGICQGAFQTNLFARLNIVGLGGGINS